MDSEVRLFKRKHSKVWQIAFTLDGRQVRVSSKKRILNDAVAAARETYLDYRFRQKNGLPVISKRFADVAALCRATMQQQLDNGVGKKSFRDYIIVIDKYLTAPNSTNLINIYKNSLFHQHRTGIAQNHSDPRIAAKSSNLSQRLWR